MSALLYGLAPARLVAQGLPVQVPLGRAAQYGLLARDSIRVTDATTALVRGQVGAAYPSAQVRAQGSAQMTSNPAVILQRRLAALADLATARAYCQTLPTQTLAGRPTGTTTIPAGPWAYSVSGTLQLDQETNLTLQGDSVTQLVIRISGSLNARGGTVVRLTGGLRPEHVFWVVDSAVKIAHLVNLPGVVLAQGPVLVRGWQFGQLAVFSGATITTGFLDPTIGQAFCAPAANPWQPSPPNPLIPPGPCANLPLNNSSFETVNPAAPHIGHTANMSPDDDGVHSEVANWVALPGGCTPDYMRTTSPLAETRVPTNFAGTQAGHNAREGYVGFYAYAGQPGDGQDPFDPTPPHWRAARPIPHVCDYIRPAINTVLPRGIVRPRTGEWYYGEFYVSLADNFGSAVEQLGICLTSKNVTERWNNGLSLTLHEPDANGAYSALGAPLVPQIRFAEAPLTNTQGWVRIAGCFQANGTEQNLIVGNFLDGAIPDGTGGYHQTHYQVNPRALSPSRAYYYLDDISIKPFPKATASDTLLLAGGTVVQLDAACLLPASSDARYWWTNDVDPGWASAPARTAALTVYPMQTTTYLLHVAVPVPGQAGQTWEVIRPITVRLGATVCRLAYGQYDLMPAQIPSTQLVLPAGRTFLATTNVTVPANATLRLESGAVLLMDPDTYIMVAGGGTLDLRGGTITASCDQPWTGIFLTEGATVLTDAGVAGRWAEISHSVQGINCLYDNSLPASSPITFQLRHTRFLHNLRGFTNQLPGRPVVPNPGIPTPNCPLCTVPVGSVIQDCYFYSDPTQFLGAYAPTPDRLTFADYHLSLVGDFRRCLIADNYFGGSWMGIQVPNLFWIDPTIRGGLLRNRFRETWLAGVYLASGEKHRVLADQNDFALPTAFEWPDYQQYDGVLDRLVNYDDAAAFRNDGDPRSFGFFAGSAATSELHLTGNRFRQPDKSTYRSFPLRRFRYPQTGAWVNNAPKATVRGNRFELLHQGLAGLYTPQAQVVENVFQDCEYAAYIAPNGQVTDNSVCINCNSFLRGNNGISPNAASTAYGIYVADGAGIQIETPQATRDAGQAHTILLGNRFANYQLYPERAVVPGTAAYSLYWPFENAVYNANMMAVESLEYLTYDNQLVPANVDWQFVAEMQPYAVLTGPGGSTNVAVVPAHSLNDFGYNPVIVSDQNNCAKLGYTTAGVQDPQQRAGAGGVVPALPLTAPPAIPVKSEVTAAAYPNPANTAFRVSYHLPKTTSVVTAHLQLIDLVTGCIVSRQILAQAQDEVSLSVAGLASGLYAYQLLVDGAVRATGRVMVVH